MTSQLLSAELTTLAQEAKRKNPDLKSSAERSLQELKSLSLTSEQQLAADLSRRPVFIDPFLTACATRNVKFASSAVVCLQRLVVTRGLPRSRLKEVLDAFNACTSLNLDIQLKILQALPGLAQNYVDDLKGEHLAGALGVCAALQSVKTQTISGVAAATLQQLVFSVFEKVAAEDKVLTDSSPHHEIPGNSAPIMVRDAAFDAYRVFLDLSLAIEGRKPRFVQSTTLPPVMGLELVGSCLEDHSAVFASHVELTDVVRSQVMPFLIRVLSERQGFAITSRAIRVALLVLQQHIEAMPEECEIILGLLTLFLDAEAGAPWKRVLCMEAFRALYATPGLILKIYMLYDARPGGKSIIHDNVASFVRISSEKPAIIGLGQQSSVPAGPTSYNDSNADQAIVDVNTGGVAGLVGSALGGNDLSTLGLSSQWSVPKTQCMDQLDKAEPPPMPETYIYSLVLECLNSLSENLAKVILPLTVQHENSRKDRVQARESGQNGNGSLADDSPSPDLPRTRTKRSQSYRSRTVPLNPLTLGHTSSTAKVKAIASFFDDCWPALLATSSTFLYSALDNDYYRALIRSLQRFAQVAGLLRLATSRDAFLTTLGKAAVPPNLSISKISGGPLSPRPDSGTAFSNSKAMLSVDSLSSQSPGGQDRNRRPSQDPAAGLLTTRNLLCLRALLNVAIAIGPILGDAFSIVLGTLHRADVVLTSLNAQQREKWSNEPAIGHAGGASTADSSGMGSEIVAVEATASRLFESIADYPNDAFLDVLTPLCRLLDVSESGVTTPRNLEDASPTSSPRHTRHISITVYGPDKASQGQHYMSVLSKLGQLSELNIVRFATFDPAESGWSMLADRLIAISINDDFPKDGRRMAVDVFTRCAIALARSCTTDQVDDAEVVQMSALSVLQLLIKRIYAEGDDLSSTDIEVHDKVLWAVRTILDTCAEALVAGWDIILAIVGSVFHEEDGLGVASASDQVQASMSLSNELISPVLGRSAFSITQLVCSDFLLSLPASCVSPLIQLLYHFASQDADLNLSLTSIAVLFDISDFLVKQGSVDGLNGLMAEAFDDRNPYQDIMAKDGQVRPAQWLLLLRCLSDVVLDQRAEVGNGAFQTLMRIFQTQSDRLSIPTWQLFQQAILIKVLRTDYEKQGAARARGISDPAALASLDQTSRALIEGVSALMSDNIDTITRCEHFASTWQSLLDSFKGYCVFRSATINAAVFQSMTNILRSVAVSTGKWEQATSIAASLWVELLPVPSTHPHRDTSEQEAFIAYTDCAVEIYRLIERSATHDDIAHMAGNLAQCVRGSKAAAYGGDTATMTSLQTRVLTLLRALRTDIAGIPATFVRIASEAVALPFQAGEQNSKAGKPSFVAYSKASMEWLSTLLASHASHPELLESGVIDYALKSLAVPIKLKYAWKQNGRSPPPWQKATSTVLQVLPLILEQLQRETVQGSESFAKTWSAIVDVACAVSDDTFDHIDVVKFVDAIEEDELVDCAALGQLQDMIMPALGNPRILDHVRRSYTSFLFQSSIIHQTAPNEMPEAGQPPLARLLHIRPGRVRDPPPSARESMSYLCFSTLLSMATVTDASEPQMKLAQAAAPYLVLRLALPIKAYIADQPLRGLMPQPLSQKEELLYCLKQMKKLDCAPEALAEDLAAGESRKIHLGLLYPLIVKAVGIAGHRRHGDREVLSALQEVLEVAR